MATTTRPHPETGELLQIVELAEAPFEQAIRDELDHEMHRLVDRYGIPKDRAVKEAHQRIIKACTAIADDQQQLITEGGYRQSKLS